MYWSRSVAILGLKAESQIVCNKDVQAETEPKVKSRMMTSQTMPMY